MVPVRHGTTSPVTWKISSQVIEHSITSVLGQQFSAKEFYTEIREVVTAQKIAGIDITDCHFSEGGPLSDERLYLKLKREYLIFEICAAPFGTSYFFSYRLLESHPVVVWWQVLLLSIILALSLWRIPQLFAPFLAAIAFLLFFGTVVWVTRKAAGRGLSDLDKVLLEIPVIGPLYARYLRKETYFREDTRIMYRNLVADIIKATIARYTAANGVKLLQEFTYTPLLDLYRTKPVAVTSNESLS